MPNFATDKIGESRPWHSGVPCAKIEGQQNDKGQGEDGGGGGPNWSEICNCSIEHP